ncbi:tyrosine-type recombinase/integrase [Streptomyces europaeiscabiei]
MSSGSPLQSGLIELPKTGKSRRTVPVGEVVTDALLAHLAARPTKEWLFTMEEGEPLNYRRWKTEWNCARRALQKAENEAASCEDRKAVELPHMVTHDLRHFYASALIAGGSSVKQVQLILGHASAVPADLRAPVAGRRRPHPDRHGRRARRHADRVRTG